MKARLKANAPMGSIRSAGEIFVKGGWQPVPMWAEAEILDNALLEVEPEPEPEPEPIKTEEPPKEKLTKMVVRKKARGKTL